MEKAKLKDIKKSGRIVLKSQLADMILAGALVNFAKVFISTLSLFVGGFIIYGPAQYGLYSAYLKATGGEKIEPRDTLKGITERFGDSFLAGLVIKLVEFIPVALLGAVALAAIATLISASTVFDFINLGLGSNTLIVSAIAIIAIAALDIACLVLMFAFSMTFAIMVMEKDCTAFEALKKSGKMMKHEKFRLLRFNISFVLWYLLIFFTSGMAAFWVIPYYYEAKATFFVEIYNRKTENRTENLIEIKTENKIEE